MILPLARVMAMLRNQQHAAAIITNYLMPCSVDAMPDRLYTSVFLRYFLDEAASPTCARRHATNFVSRLLFF
jgi:hypothetical protein